MESKKWRRKWSRHPKKRNYIKQREHPKTKEEERISK